MKKQGSLQLPFGSLPPELLPPLTNYLTRKLKGTILDHTSRLLPSFRGRGFYLLFIKTPDLHDYILFSPSFKVIASWPFRPTDVVLYQACSEEPFDQIGAAKASSAIPAANRNDGQRPGPMVT